MNKLKILFIIALIIIGIKGISVKAATSVTVDTKTYSYSPVYDAGVYYYYGAYVSNSSVGTATNTTTSNGYAGRMRVYAYFTSANSLKKTRQYTLKARVCGGNSTFGTQVEEAVPEFIHYAYNTSQSMTGAINGNTTDAVMTYTRESAANGGCVNFNFIFTPVVDNLRAVGFWVTFSRLAPVSTCWEGDCSSEHRQDDYLVSTLNANTGSFNVTSLSVSYNESSGSTAVIEQNQQTIIQKEEEIKNAVNGLPARIWATIKADLQSLFIPTDEQMEELMEETEETMTEKMGLLGLPATIYFNVMHILEDVESDSNWCFSWDAVKVPNFESYNIIQAGNWCFDSINQNEKIASMRNTTHLLMGALILLGFVGYLWNKKNIILEIPDREDYIYITEEDSFMYDIDSGEVIGNGMHKTKKTERRMKK